MQNLEQIIVDVQQNWVIYASMPFVAAAIGFVTKIIAIHMMFEPIEFVGKKPWFGWQGIVPRNAARMAGIAVDTLSKGCPRRSNTSKATPPMPWISSTTYPKK